MLRAFDPKEPMANYLTMPKKQQVLALLDLGWSYRRIQREVGVRRETVSKYDVERQAKPAKTFAGSDPTAGDETPDIPHDAPPNPAKTFPGSSPKPANTFAGSRRFTARQYQTLISEKLDAGLTVQRIWQDLVEEVGYGASYESVKRYVRTLEHRARAVGIFLSAPGDEGQADFFRGAPTLEAATGQWKRPWVFRMTLCHSRHGYEEAVWDQRLETFLRLHERAFRDFGGVPRVVRHDNLKAGVTRACFFDPDTQRIYGAFAQHWGFTSLPIQPRRPQENGKEERSGGYVKSNALKGRRFDSLDEQNAFLRRWNRTIARLRIHGTTRRQVWTHFLDVEQPALQPLAAESFPYFKSGVRTVHPDGHIEVDGAFYPVPLQLLGQSVRADWDAHLVRVFQADTLVSVQAIVPPGQYAPAPGQRGTEATTRQHAFVERLLGRCERVGPVLRDWAEAALQARGVRAIRLIQGVVGLTRRLPRERVLHAAATALEHQRFRYTDLVRLATPTSVAAPPTLRRDDPSIRPLTQYRLEDFL
jgi:transposase